MLLEKSLRISPRMSRPSCTTNSSTTSAVVPELKYLLTTTLCAQAGALKSKVKIIVAKQKRTRLITLLKLVTVVDSRPLARDCTKQCTQQPRRTPADKSPAHGLSTRSAR